MDDYYDLGVYRRQISTTSPEAQIWFDRGLNWCYGYNHEESVACFEKVAEADPECAMAYWGIGYAGGPNYNKQWDVLDEEDLQRTLDQAYSATQTALSKLPGTTPIERALIEALARRYHSQQPVENFDLWNDDYADAMRAVYHEYTNDLDVVTLFAEAIMNRTPWALWELATGKPAAGADTEEAIEVLEKALAQMYDAGPARHPGLLHIYIHLMEMSPHPERALRAGDDLRHLVPDSGHLQHMPTHIDVLCGHYHDVVESNHRAIIADRKFLERAGADNFYTTYRIHDYHFKLYGAMFLGQQKAAFEAADEMLETLPEEFLRIESPPMADWMEGYVPMKVHALIRFGKWQEIIEAPLPQDPELFCVTTAMWHYAKTVAQASSGNIEAAETEKELFHHAVARVPDTRRLFNNRCLEILGIAAEMVAGELEYRKGNFETAFEHLRKAVNLDDNLPYDEPWAWMQPARHALGALLLEQDHLEEAEAVYRADLGFDDTLNRPCQHPENVWSLHGFHECLRRLGKHTEADMIEPLVHLAMARADAPIKSSCYCRMSHARS